MIKKWLTGLVILDSTYTLKDVAIPVLQYAPSGMQSLDEALTQCEGKYVLICISEICGAATGDGPCTLRPGHPKYKPFQSDEEWDHKALIKASEYSR